MGISVFSFFNICRAFLLRYLFEVTYDFLESYIIIFKIGDHKIVRFLNLNIFMEWM